MAVSKKYLKEMQFKTLYEYFDYMHESEINGQYGQLKELTNRLSKAQFLEFITSSWHPQSLKDKCLKLRMVV